jgi:ribosomal protein L29
MAKTTTLVELKQLTVKQISDKLEASRRQLLNLRQELLLGKLKNYRQLRQLRRHIAQAATILDQKITSELATKVTK